MNDKYMADYQMKHRISIPHRVGRTVFKINEGKNELESRDFIVKSLNMRVDGKIIDPTPGDVISFKDETYEVFAPGKEPCFRYCDPYKTEIRIHTRRMNQSRCV